MIPGERERESPDILSSISVNLDDISKIIAFDKDQLYSLLGVQVLGTDTSPTKTLFSDELEAVQKRAPIQLEFRSTELQGRGWLKEHISSIKPQIKKTLCDDLNFCKDEESILNDLTVVLAALVPVIATGLGIPVATAVTIGVLLAKYYGRVLCGCPGTPSGKR